MALAPGTRIGDYTVLKKLGEGGMGEVHLCVHATTGRQVVIKGLRAFHAGNQDLKSRFSREAEVMARLAHPNIVAIYNFLETPEAAFIVMEYVDGVSFDDVLLKRGTLPPADAVELMKPVLAAVQFAHEQGVIHRDLKPSNFMLGFDDHVRVLDFGTAKLVDQPGLTRAGTTLGTANYMSPEQLYGKELGAPADVYALGVCLYEMMTAHLPFESETTSQLMAAIVLQEPTPPTKHTPTLPKAIEKVILTCLEKKAEARFASVKALEKALDDAIQASGLARKAPTKPAAPATPPAATPSQGAHTRARFDPVGLPTRTDAALARSIGVAGILAAAAGGALIHFGSGDAGLAALLAGFTLSGWSLHASWTNAARLLGVIGHAVVTARAAEEETKTLAARLALASPLGAVARVEAPPPPAAAPTGFEEAPPGAVAGGTRRLFGSDIASAAGGASARDAESRTGTNGRLARVTSWRFSPLDQEAAARVADAAAQGAPFPEDLGGRAPAPQAFVPATEVVEVSSLVSPSLRAVYAAAAGIPLPGDAAHAQRRTAVVGARDVGAETEADPPPPAEGKRTAIASVSELRKAIREHKGEA